MRYSTRVLAVSAALGVFTAFGRAQETPTAFINAHVITVAGSASGSAPIGASGGASGGAAGEFDDGVLVVHRGKIVAVGKGVAVPAGATVVDAKGKTIMPGLVDTHSHIGGVAGADGSGAIQPDVRILDSINPLDPGFRRAVAGGLTTLNVMPGSGHLLSGQTLYLKPRGSTTIEGLAIKDKDGRVLGGIKMANGTNSIGEPPFPGSRAKSAAMVRERYIKAQEYKAKRDKAIADKKPENMPDRDLGLEALCEVLEGTRIVQHHTHRADDIMTVLRLQKEFGFRVVLHHVSEAWKVADEIAAAEKSTGGKVIGCSVIVIDSPGGKLEAAQMRHETCAILEKAGARFAVHTDDWITDSRLFMRSAALALRAGASRQGMLKSLTISGAEMLDLQERVGSLEVGKDADFIVLSGDPFSVYTHVEQTWVEGSKVFDRSIENDRLFATGGFGAGREQEPYLCCYGNWFTMFGKQWQGGAGSGSGQ